MTQLKHNYLNTYNQEAIVEFIKRRSNSLTLIKILALLSMTIDHCGIFFHKIMTMEIYFIFRDIGRFAFPAFAFLLVVNFIYNTLDKKQYLKRLLIFAVISQPFFYLLQNNYLFLNVFFTLYLGMLGIYIYENSKQWLLFYVFLIWVLFHYVDIDYGSSGLLFIAFLYIAHDAIISFYSNKGLKTFLYLYFSLIIFFLFLVTLSVGFEYITLLGFVVLTILFLSKIGIVFRINKYLYYLYYPAHLTILKLLTFLYFNFSV